MSSPSAPHAASPARHFVAGWAGGSLACVLLSPLEVIKTRLQSSQGPGLSSWRLAAHIARHEGAAGFYRGLVPHLLGVGPSRAFYFGTYNFSKTYGASTLGLHGMPLHLAAAAIGSVVSSTIMSPVWVIKTRLQLQTVSAGAPGAAAPALVASAAASTTMTASENAAAAAAAAEASAASAGAGATVAYRGMADAFARVYREEGFRAFYRGLGASYLGIVETALQFALYGSMKDAVTEMRTRQLRERLAASPGGAPLPQDPRELARLAYGDAEAFCTSACAKLIAAVLTYPHEVLRTRMREQRSATPKYKSVLQTFRLILHEEGARGLYGGLGVHMVRTVPNAAILLMVVERIVGGEV
jgi:solute carrier family 25 protein 33/36